jgi:hypothetical protein
VGRPPFDLVVDDQLRPGNTLTLPLYDFSEIILDHSANQNYIPPQPVPLKGRFAIVTERGAGCDGRLRRQAGLFLPDENAAAYGEVVWSWRRDPGATPAVSPAGYGGKKGRFPGESTYKP